MSRVRDVSRSPPTRAVNMPPLLYWSGRHLATLLGPAG